MVIESELGRMFCSIFVYMARLGSLSCKVEALPRSQAARGESSLSISLQSEPETRCSQQRSQRPLGLFWGVGLEMPFALVSGPRLGMGAGQDLFDSSFFALSTQGGKILKNPRQQ